MILMYLSTIKIIDIKKILGDENNSIISQPHFLSMYQISNEILQKNPQRALPMTSQEAWRGFSH